MRFPFEPNEIYIASFRLFPRLCLELPYRVVIFPSRKHGSYHTSSNVWIMVSGTMNETQRVPVPKGSLEFIFHVSRKYVKCNSLKTL